MSPAQPPAGAAAAGEPSWDPSTPAQALRKRLGFLTLPLGQALSRELSLDDLSVSLSSVCPAPQEGRPGCREVPGAWTWGALARQGGCAGANSGCSACA